MFEAMMRMVEQQNADGAIRRPEFDPAPSSGTSPSDEGRAGMIALISASTPERHKITMADGRTAVVYFDARGRATTGVLDELDDDTLQWIAQSRDMNGNPLRTESVGRTNESLEEGRAALEKHVFAGFDSDSKGKKGGRLQVMLTGNVATAAGMKPYSTVFLGDLTPEQLSAIARLPSFDKGKAEKLIAGLAESVPSIMPMRTANRADLNEGSLASDAARNDKRFAHLKTFKLGTFMYFDGGPSNRGWFYPLADQKNDGLSGLQMFMKDNGRWPKPVKKSISASDRRAWKEMAPPDDVRAKFEEHPEFAKE